jgi:ADP-ribose pyrophosphatase
MGGVKNIFTGKVLTLNVETAMLPNGVAADLEIVRHPGAAAVVALKSVNTVVLVRQYRHAVGSFIYEIPAGKLHPGEDPAVCAARELEEEVAYTARHLELLSSIFTAPGFADEVIYIYLATGLTPGRQQLDQDEVLEIVEMPLEKAVGMIRAGDIRDAKSIVGLLLADQRLRS